MLPGIMKTTFLLLALLPILASPIFSLAADTGPANDEQQIRKIEQEWLDAILKRDATYLQKIEARDFRVTGPSGRTLNKEEDIKETASGETVFETMKIEELKVRLYGETAIANGVASVTSRRQGKEESGRYAWTDVFVKMNGEWKAVSAQVTAYGPEKK